MLAPRIISLRRIASNQLHSSCQSAISLHIKPSILDSMYAKLYPMEFDEISLLALDDQLENYIADMRSDNDFSNLKRVFDLSQKMVQKQKDLGFPLVYTLAKLALILPVATATVERAFLAMNLIKSVLRNAMGDTWLNDCLVTYIERDIFEIISNEEIMERFQKMKKRRMLL